MKTKLTLEKKQTIVNTLYWSAKYDTEIAKSETCIVSHAWDMLDVWLSEVLELDFKKDIYGNVEVAQFNRIEGVKKTVLKMGSRDWFIGDNLKQIFGRMCWQKHDSEEQILEAERLVKETWKTFLDLYNGSAKIPGATEYVEAGIVVDGEMLYRKIG